jgi:mono/diheme cytochrome c family protein
MASFSPTRISVRALALVLALTPAAALADAPQRGDPMHGEALYRLECASCHGVDGHGSEFWKKASAGKGWGAVPDLQDSAFMATRSDVQLINAMRLGKGLEGPIPHHEVRSLARLDAWDLVAYLRRGNLSVVDFYPDAARFTAHPFTIDEHGVKRLKDNLKITLSEPERTLVVITAYGGKKKSPRAHLVKWVPVELDLLDAKARLGHMVFLDIVPPGAKAPVTTGFAFGLDGKLTGVKVREPDAKKRAEMEKMLAAFVGQGEKSAVAFKAPKTVKGADRWAPVVTLAAARAAEAIVMFDKVERDRTVFDR